MVLLILFYLGKGKKCRKEYSFKGYNQTFMMAICWKYIIQYFIQYFSDNAERNEGCNLLNPSLTRVGIYHRINRSQFIGYAHYMQYFRAILGCINSAINAVERFPSHFYLVGITCTQAILIISVNSP